MSRPLTIALAGNPNAGKTSVFNALTGARQHVGNYPGVTVEYKEGSVQHHGRPVQVVDLPGTYSLTAYSPEELVARNYLIGQRPDVVVDVVDASNLERNLYLTVQLMELGVPLVVCLNMVDVAEAKGLKIDAAKLSRMLGAPVVPTVARSGRGMDELLQAAVELADSDPEWTPLEISYGTDVDQGAAEVSALLQGPQERRGLLSAHWLAVKCLEGDQEVIAHVEQTPELAERVLPVCRRVASHVRSTMDDEPESVIADYRYGFIMGITRQVMVSEREMRMDFSDKLDKVLTHRLAGPLFLFAVLYAIYEFVFWASASPVVWFEKFFGWLGGAVSAVLPEGVLRSLIVSGVIDGVGGVLGFAPLIAFMFFAIAIMEDSGYMARVAYIMDRVLRIFGLHGNSVMALIVGGGISGGCAVPGVMAARTLKDPKARLATILTVPFMNCGAKLPVFSLLIAAFFARHQAEMLFVLTLISWGLGLLAAKLLRVTVLKGEQAPFVMELPPYRAPTLKGLVIHTWERTWQYVKKAGTMILGVSILMWAAMSFPGLDASQDAAWQARMNAAPTPAARSELASARASAELAGTLAGQAGQALTVITAPLGFDWRTNVALVGGFAAKEVIVSTMGVAYSLGEVDTEHPASLSQRLAREPGWSPLAAFALMVFVMVYAPCVATLVMIRKETGGWGWAMFSLAYNTLIAYALALAVYQGGLLLGLG
ncbi:MAG: ferrous iron transport protein B [Desulfarculaceae bacterium]|nr:ferrous iron transport protein B [Desulfarculaceae bacterium]MCF8073073.1 ferrous iron transport protein B [Desulfarculaceae bacterium]MCF8101842.1 ferrous iron transport protein B [Desulfarculaceae bacterium]MCF8115369.1 ferrous iron transport protein B [Desulfarculaceae bacterium]